MRVGVLGVGVMGIGVAQCLAGAGHDVVAVDPDDGARASAPTRLRDGLRLHALLGGPGARHAPGTVLARVRWAEDPAALAEAEFVVECVLERLPVKEAAYRALDRVCPRATVFASCTSAIPIGLLGGFTGRPDRVIGTHFMNPAPLKPAVEVVRAEATSDDTLDRTVRLLAGMGKRAIVVGDAPGFVSNRVLMLAVNQAAEVAGAGTADADTVDEVFETCLGHPMGPLRTADLIGLDTVLDTLLVLRECTGDAVFEPCRQLRDLVRAGRLGRKSGRGFHDYSGRGDSLP
ncbi:3-hydroxyacyl-CoA dehydrogenase family protein [Solihabitans fulvus]|uniref:3-hydroxyacyl-CoA dehydrogenase family protein n=1 Tax=Solihabitans fulvus TaxID=1892852 RepID=A0A5B2XUQ8_9PSEU|nr:3-hydroxyacyl-CoA dehydrogenase family protein [Solihabitans fulvus]KAA2266544.1 3-hydroxyacyl-CoA dehydrogenase family protein [Solihabitans fulvus]